ncbi:MAG: deoxyribose-phosphate aldolase [Spirochaetes bacterium]|nr:deoxyribose-phosphate aldolase [Spirochaetota bacterium]
MLTEQQIREITEKVIEQIKKRTEKKEEVRVNPREIINAGADRISTRLGAGEKAAGIAGMIDHTLLKADASIMQIRNLCGEAKRYGFISVCVNPCYVPFCFKELQGSLVKVCTVVGFPLGATSTQTKAFETENAITNGAAEIDMVLNIGFLKSKNFDGVEQDIKAVVKAARGNIVKVILETALLTHDEIEKACQLARSAGADFVKTSTGFARGGATVRDIELMRRTVGSAMGVKASGGIKSLKDARAMVEAGATRIGASASVAIVKGETSGTDY